jgi:hypothetical protein
MYIALGGAGIYPRVGNGTRPYMWLYGDSTKSESAKSRKDGLVNFAIQFKVMGK